MPPLLQKLILKFLSEQKNQIKMASLLPHGVLQYHHEISRTSRFRTFWGENVTFLRDYDVITRGFPQKLGIPRDFVTISYRNVRYNTLM